ncbi:hypothetical protein [Virgibacillus ndiopensis]|uniref:hypothetical protein n=1 Tax=Virgibacillus ndiopensis TaxID=2004408 RepID=UPI001FE81F89|nr:hypothetical protein [Virgibacillus ndiopensis]
MEEHLLIGSRKIKRSALTLEVSPYVGNRPVPISSFKSIWRENNTIGLMIVQEASTDKF